MLNKFHKVGLPQIPVYTMSQSPRIMTLLLSLLRVKVLIPMVIQNYLVQMGFNNLFSNPSIGLWKIRENLFVKIMELCWRNVVTEIQNVLDGNVILFSVTLINPCD